MAASFDFSVDTDASEDSGIRCDSLFDLTLSSGSGSTDSMEWSEYTGDDGYGSNDAEEIFEEMSSIDMELPLNESENHPDVIPRILCSTPERLDREAYLEAAEFANLDISDIGMEDVVDMD